MAELLLRVIDRGTPSLMQQYVKLTNRGDIDEVCENGWGWSDLERSLPFWRILRVPDMGMEEAVALMAREPGDPVTNPYLQSRAFCLSLDQFTGDAKTWLDDDTRALPTMKFSAGEVRAMKVLKPAIRNPKVIG